VNNNGTTTLLRLEEASCDSLQSRSRSSRRQCSRATIPAITSHRNTVNISKVMSLTFKIQIIPSCKSPNLISRVQSNKGTTAVCWRTNRSSSWSWIQFMRFNSLAIRPWLTNLLKCHEKHAHRLLPRKSSPIWRIIWEENRHQKGRRSFLKFRKDLKLEIRETSSTLVFSFPAPLIFQPIILRALTTLW